MKQLEGADPSTLSPKAKVNFREINFGKNNFMEI
jgi:hypothetical protein